MKANKNNIPVFLSSDNNFSPMVATTIASIMDYSSSGVDFYILDGGIYEENKSKIIELKEQYGNINIEFIKIKTSEKFKDFPIREHFTRDMYTRFLIPILKPEIDLAIYSDVDVIFNGDITEIYKENLGGLPLGAVPYTYGYLNPDQQLIEMFHKTLKLPGGHKYFESGLLIIDCKQWREKKITEQLIKTAKERGSDILTPDQDVFNIVFANNYKELDNKYIVVPGRTNIMYTDKSTRGSIKKPFIFHFAGPTKPWNDPTIEYSEFFWKYARKTSFCKHLLSTLARRTRLENRIRPTFSRYSVFPLLKYTKNFFFFLFGVAVRIYDTRLGGFLTKNKRIF